MKFVLLAAAAVLAAPLMAQTTPASADQTTAPADQMEPGTAPAPADPAAQQPSGGMSDAAPAGDPSAADPAGGYQPSAPPMQGTPQAGQTVTFQQAPSPSQAFPAPAPMQNYPICKKGQYDNCMQRGGR
ncbi:hypothetical protein [Sphingomonas sp.]|uniref:hypothetical protein n=1 Tax=Sphingomonas sp. TaxID=28214 RepID=UPI0035C797E6